MQWTRLALLWTVVIARSALAAGAPASTVIASIDLSQTFGTRSAWRFTASQGPSIADPFGAGDDQVPGKVDLCLANAASGPCDPHLQGGLQAASDDPQFSEPHYLNEARVVRSHGTSGRPVLLVVTASLHSGDGDQLVLTQALAYDAAADRFVQVYRHSTGTNNNQEVRQIAAGPLAGDIISAEPTENAPFGFWVSVNTFAPTGYKQVLRYRSATTYGDGNPLPVIDSEMVNIQRHLGFWRPGAALPRPTGPCPRPHLIRMELWCG